MEPRYDDLTEALLEAPCQVIDFLPRQVPAQGGGRYFAVEAYLTEPRRLKNRYRRFASLVLKLYCYYDLVLGDGEAWTPQPPPEVLARAVVRCAKKGYLRILFPAEEVLLTLEGGDLYLALYHPSEPLLETVRALAAAEGMFVRPGA